VRQTALARWPAAAAGGIVLLAGLVYLRALDSRTNYDEGVYLASLDALRRGERLGEDVYAVQPPGFYSLLRVLAAPFGHSLEGIRLAFVLLALAGALAAFACASRLYGAAAGLAAAAFLVIGPPFPTVAPTVAADVPSIAIALIALALLAVAVQQDAHPAWAESAGAVLTFAVGVKFLAAPYVMPFVAISLAARAGRRVLLPAAAGGAAVVLLLVLLNVGALGELYDGVVADHEGAKALSSVGDNADRLRHLLEWRTPFAWLVWAGAISFVVSRRARRVWPLATVVPAAAAFTLYLRPLNDHHLVLMSSAYAVSAGPALALALGGLGRRAQLAGAAVVCLFVAAGFVQEHRRLARNDLPERPELLWAAQVIEAATGPSDVVASDQPLVNFLTGRPFPGYLSDTSNTRFASGALTGADVLARVDHARAAAVLTGRMFRFQPELLEGLRDRYGVRLQCGDATLYLLRPPAGPGVTCRL
jgi:4-amino-4-deoxy-L-arabinose transferase-like glycosyltransferase